MIDSFLLIDEFLKDRIPTSDASEEAVGITLSGPRKKLAALGYRTHPITNIKDVQIKTIKADAAVLSVSMPQFSQWRDRVLQIRSIPVIWWCDSFTFSNRNCSPIIEADGVLTAGMTPLEVQGSLLLTLRQYNDRTAWLQEREQLISRLEERKWIDQAKAILTELKNITEAEAYDFLRKQAMNERKRLVDVSMSIVKVYQLLQDQKTGGRTK